MKDLVDAWVDRAVRLEPQPGVRQWWQQFGQIDLAGLGTAHRAIAGGIIADRLAWVFVAGYQAALNGLRTDPGRLGALLVSEGEGEARTRLTAVADGYVLVGQKSFAALCNHVEWLLVEALDDRDTSVLVHVERFTRGVVMQPGPRQAFLPELDRGAVHFMDTAVARDAIASPEALPALKRFRIAETLHVMRAGLGYLLKRMRDSDGPEELRGEIMRLLLLLQKTKEQTLDYTEASIRAERLLESVEDWAGAMPWFGDFERNRAVFSFASERFRGWIAR